MLHDRGFSGTPGVVMMRHGPKRIEVALETLFESVDRAEEISLRAAQSCGFSEDDCQKIGLSVREGVVNAIRYGNQQQREKRILVTVEMCDDKLVVRILDQGRGFNLADVPDPLAQENLLKTSGRGIFLMRTFMDEFVVLCPSGGGAELVMTKRLRHPRNGASPL
jgi:serine/threonine-protein kinase RsbW